ncbi:MAG: pyridoxal-phosphate dependent enzyme [Chloroflexaceae bacterium]|jgi:threonine dehydratase|nr:pyridoxal-phosphate dependent enzyme [Chloroflexaceae bacterium]
MSYNLPLATIEAARQRIALYVRHTPLLPLPALRGDLPPQLRLKLENLQVTGSFKARGVFNTLLQLSQQQREWGVVAASGGNHGLALAYGAWRLGIPATVYLPATASADRVARVQAWGARVVQHGSAWDDAHSAAVAFAEAEGLTYVHPFDADATLAGQGTLGLELLDDLPELDYVLIAIGGGGLIAGMAAAIKQRRPRVRIVGVEPVGAASMQHSLAAGRVSPLPAVKTIADTLSPRSVSERTLILTQQYVDDVVLVDDGQMVAAMQWLWAECNQLVEPAGAAVIAALQNGKVSVAEAACPVALVCGGNAAAASVFAAYNPSEPR